MYGISISYEIFTIRNISKSLFFPQERLINFKLSEVDLQFKNRN